MMVGGEGTPGAVSAAHRAHLRTSGLSDATIEAAGLYSEPDPKKVGELLRWRSEARSGGLVIPYFELGNQSSSFVRVRPDKPRKRNGKVVKYEQPAGVAVLPYLPRLCWRSLVDPSAPLHFVEGEKKALLLAQLGYAVVGAAGVSCFHDSEFRSETEEWRLHPALDGVPIEGRECRIVFDSDSSTNPDVMRAAERLAWLIEKRSAKRVVFIKIPGGDEKVGIDDFHVKHGEDRTRALLVQGEPIRGRDPGKAYIALASLPALRRAGLSKDLRLPKGWTIDRHGSVYKKARTDDGEDKKVLLAPLLVTGISLDVYTGEEHAEVSFPRDGKWVTRTVARASLRDGRGIVSALAPYGAPVASTCASDAVRWMADLEHVNERFLPRARCVTRCGWHDVGTGPAHFVAPGLTDPPLRFAGDANSTRGLGVRGEIETHREALARACHASPLATLAIMGALAGPLLKPLRAPSFAIHLVGESSVGKTTMLRAAASVFGDPVSPSWVASWQATRIGLEQRAAALCDLPLCVDEAGTADDKERAKVVYMLANGVGKSRGARSGGIQKTQDWRTVLISTGERELVASDANTGAQVRVLQATVRNFGDWGARDVDRLTLDCAANFGHIGAQWLAALSRVSGPQWGEMRATAREVASEIQGDGQGLAARQAQYWATLVATEALAHELLGIGSADGETLRALADSPDATRKVKSAGERAIAEFGDWFEAHRLRGFAKIEHAQSGRRSNDSNIRGEQFGWYDAEWAYVIPSALKNMLRCYGHDMRVTRQWIREGWASAQGDRLSKVVKIDGRLVRCVVIKRRQSEVDASPLD